jgi:O-antigen/teichoic acid export membrane protein
MLLSQTMSWSATQIPRFILGLYLGAAELGLFSLGSRIHEIVLQLTLSPTYAVARVKMREYADDRVGLNAAVTSLLKNMALLCFPLCIGGAAVMPVLFHVWLDTRWSAGVLAAQLLLLGAMPYVAHYALSAALLAMNRQSSIAVNSTVQSIATVIVTALFAPLGLNPATASIALRPMATVIFPLVFAQWHCGIPASLVLRAQVPIFIAASVMGAVVWALEWGLRTVWNPAFLLGALVVTGAAVYALMIGTLQPGLLAIYWARLPFKRRGASKPEKSAR